jgi:hypothetical protein
LSKHLKKVGKDIKKIGMKDRKEGKIQQEGIL